MGGDDDALGMETKIIEKVVGHDGKTRRLLENQKRRLKAALSRPGLLAR
jgi:hypothetical protein